MAGSSDYLILRQHCDELLREGRGHLVTLALADLDVETIPKLERVALAVIARRANLFSLGLKILAPLMVQLEATGERSPVAMAEYGFLLHKIGSTLEALKIFGQVDARSVSDVLLFRAFCHFSRWEYQEALTALEEYVALPEVPTYQRLVGKVNLASACIVLRRDEMAEQVLSTTLEECRAGAHARLTANCLELSAQIAIREHRFSRAEDFLTEALRVLAADSTSDRLFVEKWKAVIFARRDRDVTELRKVRATAEKAQHWETIREVDRHLALATSDEKLFRKLFFGSPFAGYRRILTEESGFSFVAPDDYVVGEGGLLLDVSTGEVEGKCVMKPGKATHRLFAAMMSDFYRPFKLGDLYSALFPDERFDVFSSPNRVYQILFRTREFFVSEGLPLVIEENHGFFRLTRTGAMRMRLIEALQPVRAEAVHLLRLFDLMSDREFATREAVAALKISETSCKRVLRYGLETGELVRVGSGASIRYRRAAGSAKKVG